MWRPFNMLWIWKIHIVALNLPKITRSIECVYKKVQNKTEIDSNNKELLNKIEEKITSDRKLLNSSVEHVMCVYVANRWNRKQEQNLPHDIPFQLRKPLASIKHPIYETVLHSLQYNFNYFWFIFSLNSMSPRKLCQYPLLCTCLVC